MLSGELCLPHIWRFCGAAGRIETTLGLQIASKLRVNTHVATKPHESFFDSNRTWRSDLMLHGRRAIDFFRGESIGESTGDVRHGFATAGGQHQT